MAPAGGKRCRQPERFPQEFRQESSGAAGVDHHTSNGNPGREFKRVDPLMQGSSDRGFDAGECGL
jgi:hypothetical protein